MFVFVHVSYNTMPVTPNDPNIYRQCLSQERGIERQLKGVKNTSIPLYLVSPNNNILMKQNAS